MNAKKTAALLASHFSHRATREGPLVVGIDGLGGSGKTTFTGEIQQALKNSDCDVYVFHLDDHIVEKHQRYHTGNEEWFEYYFLQWDIAGLVDLLLKRLHRKEHITLPYYDQVRDTVTLKKIGVLTACIVLIEGVFLQRAEWRAFFDFVIYLDCPFDMRKSRVLDRDAYIGSPKERLEKYTTRYWPAERYYESQINPSKYAEVVIPLK